jgi:dihydrofolate synthase/folylpolyglutamate synthase
VPAAVAAAQEPEVHAVLRARAEEVGAPLACAEVTRGLEGRPEAATAIGPIALRPAVPGAHHLGNAAVAAHALALLPPALRPRADVAAAGIARATPPGRFQRLRARGVDWILDVAHNPAGIAALGATLRDVRPARPLVGLVGIVADKDWAAMLDGLAPVLDRVVVTSPLGVPEERRWDPVAAAAASGHARAREAPAAVADFRAALELATALAASRSSTGGAGDRPAGRPRGGGAGPGTVVVCGSFHTVGAALELLQGSGAVAAGRRSAGS